MVMRKPLLPNIDAIHAKNPRSKKKAISAEFFSTFNAHFFKNTIFTIITLGLFAQKMHRQAKSRVLQAIAARKISFIVLLMSFIKKEREQVHFTDPRQGITTIFMKLSSKVVESDNKKFELSAIYSSAELLLFITNPIREMRQARLPRFYKKHVDYIRLWQEMKRKSKVNQFRQIKSINFYIKCIKEQFLLSQIGIHDRLMRSSIYRKAPQNLTMFKELSLAFLEIIVAYEEFEVLKESDKDLYQLLSMLSLTSQEDVKKLREYMDTGKVQECLTPENRKQLIQLGNRQRILYSISDEAVLDMCALILDKHQWEFLLSLQKVSDVSLNLLDWAYDQTPNVIDDISFSEKLLSGSLKTIAGKNKFSSFLQEDDNAKHMLEVLAEEEGRRWPRIEIYVEGQLLFQADENLTVSKEHIKYVYNALFSLCLDDTMLLALLQKSLTREGKNSFEQAVDEGVLKLLGERSAFFIPVLTNTKIVIAKQKPSLFSLNYFFSQSVHRQGEEHTPSAKQRLLHIRQDIHKEGLLWLSKPLQATLGEEKVL